MKMIDYRNTEFCKKMTKISRKKKKLLTLLQKEHPRGKINYNIIKNYYREKFYNIYNNKCAYCGASMETLGMDRLEIDHFIHESSFGKDNIKAGNIKNLVTACYACNRRKGSFLIENDKKFNPDFKTFKKLFYRNSNYEIKIFYKYLNDKQVIRFYEILKLGAEFRRLDFLILKILKLIEKLEKIEGKEEEISDLAKLHLKLLRKRNKINPLSN